MKRKGKGRKRTKPDSLRKKVQNYFENDGISQRRALFEKKVQAAGLEVIHPFMEKMHPCSIFVKFHPEAQSVAGMPGAICSFATDPQAPPSVYYSYVGRQIARALDPKFYEQVIQLCSEEGITAKIRKVDRQNSGMLENHNAKIEFNRATVYPNVAVFSMQTPFGEYTSVDTHEFRIEDTTKAMKLIDRVFEILKENTFLWTGKQQPS